MYFKIYLLRIVFKLFVIIVSQEHVIFLQEHVIFLLVGSPIFQLYHGKNTLHFDEMMMSPL
jgi:hypothetical protein